MKIHSDTLPVFPGYVRHRDNGYTSFPNYFHQAGCCCDFHPGGGQSIDEELLHQIRDRIWRIVVREFSAI
jgi:hypothetical protein